MQRDYDAWNLKKKSLNEKTDIPFFREGEIWWIHLGVNIGYELNGKGKESTRPVIILKKYNQYSFLALPLSTSTKKNNFRVFIGIVAGKEAIANISQIRNTDSKRLVRKIGYLNKNALQALKEKTSLLNFG